MTDDPTLSDPGAASPMSFLPAERGGALWSPEATLLHLSYVITALERRVLDRFALAHRANDKFEMETARHFVEVNGLHALMLKQMGEQLGREEYTTAHAALDQKIDAALVRIERIEARGLGSKDTWAWLVAACGIAFGVLTHFWK